MKLLLATIYCLSFSQLGFSQATLDLNKLIFDPIPIQITENDGQILIAELPAFPLESSARATINPRTPADSSPESNEEAIAQYEQSILELQLAEGAYAEDLSENLLALGLKYQDNVQHQLALDTLNEALHNHRLQNGLFDLGQTPILKAKIKSHLFNGDLNAVSQQQDYLLYLARKEYGYANLAVVPALEAHANWNVIAALIPTGILPTADFTHQLSASNAQARRHDVNLQNYILHSLETAIINYDVILQILNQTSPFNSKRIIQIEEYLILSNYLLATYYEAVSRSQIRLESFFDGADRPISIRRTPADGAFKRGREALQRREQYLQEYDLDPNKRINAALELADWHLMFNNRSTAHAHYQKTLALIAGEGFSEAETKEFLSPNLPQAIPSFIKMPFSRAANNIPPNLDLSHQGYIDLTFNINRAGYSRALTVISVENQDEDSNHSRIKEILVNQLNSTQFRPTIIERGDKSSDDSYSIRYYYHY